MRHQIPGGEVGKILAKAVAVLLKQVRARKFGECSAPRGSRNERDAGIERAEPAERIEPAERVEQTAESSPSRMIPAAIRRAVSKRDGERCTFGSATGHRCGSRDFLEFHHREPWARHRSHAIDEITLRCRAHNQYAAERDFGWKHMQRFRRRNRPPIADLLTETSASFLDTEALLANPSVPAALQSELDLNPVGVRSGGDNAAANVARSFLVKNAIRGGIESNTSRDLE